LKLFNRVISCLLIVIMLFSSLPAALAANEYSVLTSIGHSDTNTVTLSGSTRQVTLTVPFDYPGTALDLVNGLDIAYFESLYKSVVVVPASAATIDDQNYISVVVTFNHITDADDAAKNQTIYYVRVMREAQTDAAFSGVISKTIQGSGTIPLSASDFNAIYSKNDGEALGYITISGSNLVAGTLMHYDSISGINSNYEFNTPISAASLNSLSFDASSYGTVSYDVNAYEAVTSEYIGTAVLTITVYATPTIQSTIAASVFKGSSIRFSASDFTSRCNIYGVALQSVEITPTNSDVGTWYLGTTALSNTSATVIPASQLGSLSFLGSANGGTAFQWRVTTVGGVSGYGTGTITVSAPTLTLSSYAAFSNILKGTAWTVSTSNFSYSPSTVSISYIKILSIPAAADGTLCLTTALAKNDTYGYPAIGANASLTAGAVIPYDSIKYLKINTKSTSTNTSLSFTWTATADSIISTATWAAAASYTVGFVSGGTVSYTTDMNIPLLLNASDFSSQFANATGSSLSHITFTLPAKTIGTLYYNYNVSTKTGTAVTSAVKYYTGSSPNLSYITFVPAANYIGTASIAYTAYKADGTYVAGTLQITVSNSSGGTFSYMTDKNAAVRFDAADFSTAFLNATGDSLSYVKFSLPSSSCGKLYYDYSSSSSYDATVSASTKYYVYSSSYLSYVSFVPHADYTGTVTIGFTGYTSSGSGYSGKLIIFVVDSPAGIVSYTTMVNGTVALSANDFADEFISVTGSVLSYVVITPPAAASGSLYYNYSSETAAGTKVAAATKYYSGTTPDISDITFVPAKDFIGTVEVKYTVYTASGTSYIGKLKFYVGEATSGNVSYSTEQNTAFSLYASDFSSKFYTNTGGSTLAYVTFTPPSSTYGKLYYNYTSSTSYGSAVAAGTIYHVNAPPYLSNITFVPKTGYFGSFTIAYTGFTTDGTGYAGKIKITVESDHSTVTYETTSLERVTFSSSDFSTAFKNETGETLYYVMFNLPSSSYGQLYYNYTSSSSSPTAVTSSTRYYVNSWPYLSSITFVPNSSLSGTFSVDYVAYAYNGGFYSGTVVISVTSSNGGKVNYTTGMNTPVALDSNDFNSVFLDETGSSLYYVKFTLPPTSRGQLYFASSSGNSSKVTAATKYYRSISPLLSDITFVPYLNYVGTVTIQYVGYNASGDSFAGELTIAVKDYASHPFTDVGERYSWANAAIAYLYNQEIVTGAGNTMFNPGNRMSRGDFMLMIYKAFDLEMSSSGNFSDVSPSSYYYDAIAAARALGIAQGNNGRFYPATELSRQDAMVLIMRTLRIVGKPLAAGSVGDLAGFSDTGSISSYAIEAVATLVKAGIITGSGGAINPLGVIGRGEMAAILYRVLTM